MPIAAVILAAGSSTRFGSAKQLVRIGPRTMLASVAHIAESVGLEPIVAVVPPGTPVPAGIVAEPNDVPDAGLSHSLRLGVAAAERLGADGVVVLLGDQPTLDPDVLLRLFDEGGEAPVVAAWADGRIGPPILLRRSAFGLVAEAEGDEGLRTVLAAHPELVARVPVGAHAPDVDVPADLDRVAPNCPGCGARFADAPTGETHPYIGASPGCWAAFTELLAREYGDPAYGAVHRHTVDVYATQHPGHDDRRERQSVALHLIALCQWLEHGVEVPRLNAITQRLASEDRPWPWLDPPTAFTTTVLDALEARNGPEHVAAIRRWAEAVWDAWKPHHDVIRGWAADALR